MPDCKKKCFLHKFLSKIIGLQAGENKIGVFSRENAVFIVSYGRIYKCLA